MSNGCSIPLRWVGSKTWLVRRLPFVLEAIRERLTAGGRYHEPFLGAGRLATEIASAGHSRLVLSDANPDLVNLWRAVREAPTELLMVTRRLQADHDADQRATYYRERALYNETRDDLQLPRMDDPGVLGNCCPTRAARLVYLNKTGFNGLYRVNKSGGYNVPIGRYKRPRCHLPEEVRACSAVLQPLRFATGDFGAALQQVQPGDVVYLDPPYVPLSATSSFTSYTGAFGLAEQERLASTARLLALRGALVIASNSSAPLVRELYSGSTWALAEVPVGRSVSRKGSGRGAVPELLISNDHDLIARVRRAVEKEKAA